MSMINLVVKDIKEWRITTSHVKYMLPGLKGLNL